MAYCTLADLKQRLAESDIVDLTDDAGVGAIDTAKVTEAITDADAEINNYLRGRYVVPLATPIDPMIKKISAELTIINLYARRGNLSEVMEKRQARSLASLRDLQSGKAILATDPPAPEVDASGFRSNKCVSDRMFPQSVLDTMA